MEIELQARHLDMNPAVRDYVNKKVGRLDRYLPDIKAIRVDLDHGMRRTKGEIYTAQITTWVDSTILRAEEMDHDLFAAIDMAADKLHRQVERYKGRRLDRWHDHAKPLGEPAAPVEYAETEETVEAAAGEAGHVVRRKRYSVFPMSEAEAVEQLNLLGHDFFLFMNADNGHVNVVYRRKDGNYGLIQPVVA